MRLFLFFTAVFTGLTCFGQVNTESNPEVVKQDKLKGEIVPPEKRETYFETFQSPEVQYTRYYSISRENPVTVEISREAKIAELEMFISSVESKIFLLEEDPVGNALEIQEKRAALEEKQVELQLLKIE
ncbi:MAG: hypothetical protein A3D92_15935 [Bacteroidetes bacterium RIFCSPHIGHO2_02_FULL_44_7]|nr:MAG: hypothetical protein A3D92_15935 [Bacteroidetes bacterium RIFCSPHIGHO2_02_FULL_44_7]